MRTGKGEVIVPTRPEGRPVADRIREGIGIATDLRYLSQSVGGYGGMEGVLYFGARPQARRTRVRTSGGVVVCPLCGMPMEKITVQRAEGLREILPKPESSQDIWRCLHEFPVYFVHLFESSRPGIS